MKTIKLKDKFSERDLDKFIDRLYKAILSNPHEKFVFDLSELTWISNQEILLLTSILRYFFLKGLDFEIVFYKKGLAVHQITKRIALQIIQIWDVWKIWKILPIQSDERFFGIDTAFVESLKKFHNIKNPNYEIYSRHNITPFIELDYLNNYDDKLVESVLQSYYTLNKATEEIVKKNNCAHPFIDSTIGSIITKELYENFLDHFSSGVFNSTENSAFMSLSLKSPVKNPTLSNTDLQNILEKNFNEEALEESKDFFYNSKAKEYKNEACLQFSFLDFGIGIVETLKDQYKIDTLQTDKLIIDESDVLKYAFTHSSSRHPTNFRYNKRDEYVPRGLFDLLCIVKRYSGLIVVRSNYGKILYDFSNNKSIEEAFSKFGDENLFFPGTLISIYLPALTLRKTDNSSIKPLFEKHKYTSKSKIHIDVYHIINKLKGQKKDLYTNLLGSLSEEIRNNSNTTRTIFLSFRGYKNDKRLTKKILFFLLSDYEININNNLIVLHPPSHDLYNEINDEILLLNEVTRKYKIHPLPFIYYDAKSEEIQLKWLGIYDEKDKIQLDNLLFEDFPLSRPDFIDPDNLPGNVIFFDQAGNLKSNLPNRDALIKYYKFESHTADEKEITRMISENACITPIDDNILYLCNGNYYQKQFIGISKLLNNNNDCNLISEILFKRLSSTLVSLVDCIFVGITSSSHKIIESMIAQKFIFREKTLFYDNYHVFNSEENNKALISNSKYILICDAIASGTLTVKLEERLLKINSDLIAVGVIANTIDESFKNSKLFLEKYEDKLFAIHNHKIEKLEREKISTTEFNRKTIVRINPFTNTPITLSLNDTLFERNTIMPTLISFDDKSNQIINSNPFLNIIKESSIKIGYLQQNNLIHPYFFNTKEILSRLNEDELKPIFSRINIDDLQNLLIFCPKNSPIEHLNFELIKNKIFKNQSIPVMFLERFLTHEGWKFPHVLDYISNIDNETILVMDDGSCSGDTLLQMLDELLFFKLKKVVVISFIGRISDHKKEFLSRLNFLKSVQADQTEIQIYFVSHWHIPTYFLSEDPNSGERNWLNEILKLQNTPSGIKKIAQKIKKAIEPVILDDFKDYKFLPKNRETNDIPKKAILSVREEIGKIIGYRFYKENFYYFDLIIKKYQNKNTLNRYKEIELLCAVFIYEPYLFSKIKEVTPDIVQRIEDFITAIIFGNPLNNKSLNINRDLHYIWEKKDLVHLFFVVYKDKHLLNKLQEGDNFNKLIQFIEPEETGLNYILYNLLKYFPVNKDELKQKLFVNEIKEIIAKKIAEVANHKSYKHHLNRFYKFLLSLPTHDDLKTQLNKIRDNYNIQKGPQIHDEKASFNHNISLFLKNLRELKSANVPESMIVNNINEIINCWFNIQDFLLPILSFSKSYEDYLMPYPYYKLYNSLENDDKSLRELVSQNDESIFSLDSSNFNKEKINQIEKNILNIQSNFGIDTEFNELFEHQQTNFYDFINKLETEINTIYGGVKTNCVIQEIDKSIYINVPKLYSSKLIIKELVLNLENHSKTGQEFSIELSIFANTENSISNVSVEIISEIADKEYENSTGEGLKCLKLMSDVAIFGFNYKYDIHKKNKYKQVLTFSN